MAGILALGASRSIRHVSSLISLVGVLLFSLPEAFRLPVTGDEVEVEGVDKGEGAVERGEVLGEDLGVRGDIAAALAALRYAGSAIVAVLVRGEEVALVLVLGEDVALVLVLGEDVAIAKQQLADIQ